MEAEETLQYMMDFYPEIFMNRKDCLNQLFCTIGNGYYWENGELISNDTNEYLDRWQLKNPIKHAEPSASNKQNEAIRIANAKRNKMFEFQWYPLSKEYSYLYNYPENIKPDWLKLIKETKRYLKEDGIEF